ncbi:hypothetical protein ACFLZP_02285 [Patescibacteria group bacterium]
MKTIRVVFGRTKRNRDLKKSSSDEKIFSKIDLVNNPCFRLIGFEADLY